MKQYNYTILIYCNIYYSSTIQYSLKEILIYCTLQYILIYYNIFQCLCLNVLNAWSLHHKHNWISRNLNYTFGFFTLLYSYTGCIFFSLLLQPIFPYEMTFYQNPIKYCNMAIYCNTLKYNTQYGIDPYYFTPKVQCM